MRLSDDCFVPAGDSALDQDWKQEMEQNLCVAERMKESCAMIESLVEVRDSRTGYLVPGHVGPGLRQMSRVVGKPPPSLGYRTLETVLVFGLESVSYERSRRAKHAKMQHFSAHVFFEIIPTQF